MEEIERLRTENEALKQLFKDALAYGFERWIMDKARELIDADIA